MSEEYENICERVTLHPGVGSTHFHAYTWGINGPYAGANDECASVANQREKEERKRWQAVAPAWQPSGE